MADMPSKGQSPYGPTVKAYIDNGDAGVASDLEDHEDSTTGVHGIPDTSLLETQAGAQAKANSAKSGAEGTAAANLTAHVTKASGAHAASAISYAGGAVLPASSVEAALDALESRVVAEDFSGDLNTLVNSATYRTIEGANAPIAGVGFLEVTRRASSMTQEYTSLFTPVRRFIRHSGDSGAAWSPWREVAFKGALAATDIAYAGGTLLPASSVEVALDTLDARAFASIRSGSPDFNLLTAPGTYFINSTTAPNAPAPVGGFLEVEAYTNTFLQVYRVPNPGAQYQRRSPDNGVSWSPWTKFLSNLPEAGNTIVGTGMPNGVVVAPVGTRYVDTAATNGAREWYKATGTGNTGWIVTNGDTGWRRDTSLLNANWVLAVNPALQAFDFRRINERVYQRIGVSPAEGLIGSNRSAGQDLASATPLGFGRAPSDYRPLGTIKRLGSLIDSAIMPTTGQQVTQYGGSLDTGALTAGDQLIGSAEWITQANWPTTLPGTPV